MYPKGVIPSSTTASLKLIVVCAFPHMSSWVKFITRSIINFTSWTQLRVHDSGFAIHESLLRWVNALYVRLRVRTQCALHAVKRRMLSLTLRSRVSCMDRNSGWSGVWKLAPLRCEAILVILVLTMLYTTQSYSPGKAFLKSEFFQKLFLERRKRRNGGAEGGRGVPAGGGGHPYRPLWNRGHVR